MAIKNRTTYDGNGNVLSVEEIEYDAAPYLKVHAQEALDKSDTVVIRCMEKGINLPAAWADYRASLRIIVNTGEGSLPAIPDYP